MLLFLCSDNIDKYINSCISDYVYAYLYFNVFVFVRTYLFVCGVQMQRLCSANAINRGEEKNIVYYFVLF